MFVEYFGSYVCFLYLESKICWKVVGRCQNQIKRRSKGIPLDRPLFLCDFNYKSNLMPWASGSSVV